MEGLLQHYETKLPSDERQAAGLAGEEADRLIQMLEKVKELKGRDLLTRLIRVLQFGTALAELMKYGLEER